MCHLLKNYKQKKKINKIQKINNLKINTPAVDNQQQLLENFKSF
jgi:hypothetical protein